tara:strand:+ start:2709 stop:5750 length:3042 start_codon:yes stop_codon:yes gene_type:complete
MSIKKYKFVSPGIFVSEIDNSQLPALANAQGPVIIGRSQRGPSLRPVQVNSFSEFVNVFGNPVASQLSPDQWRLGISSAPMYAVYAAQAWFKNNSPVTFVRLLGNEHPQKASGGEAGWATKVNGNGAVAGNGVTGGGAYGLFITPSASLFSDGSTSSLMTGSLAAVWYMNSGYIALSGVLAATTAASASGATTYDLVRTSSQGVLIQSLSEEKAFVAEVYNSSHTVTEKISFSLSRTSNRYIRKVFNTNPPNTNSRITTNNKEYFLGETYDRHFYESFALNGAATPSAASVGAYGVILPLKLSDDTAERSDNRKPAQAAQTGWFFSQDLVATTPATNINTGETNAFQAESQQKLFKIHSLNADRWDSKSLKISVTNIKPPANSVTFYGSFSIQIRKIEDIDSAVQIIEQFDNCNLNPDSENYLAKIVGDKYRTWDTTGNRYIENGDYENNSKFIRVEIDGDVANGSIEDKSVLPFGVYGPLTWKNLQFFSEVGGTGKWNFINNQQVTQGDGAWLPMSASAGTLASTADFLTGISLVGVSGTYHSFASNQLSYTASLVMPKIYLRVSSSAGRNQSPSSVYFGADTTLGAAGYATYDQSTADVLRAFPKDVDGFTYTAAGPLAYSWIFTLDDITQKSGANDIVPNADYVSGSRANGESITALTGTWQSVLDAGFDSFTTVLANGADGLNIYESEPFNNADALSADATDLTSYAYYSVKKAIDSISDAEVVEYNLAAVPGVTNEGLNDYLVSVCEDRGDALAVIDLPSVYQPGDDAGTSGANRYGNNPDKAITALKNRGLNSSYACAYYPWIQMKDTINNKTLWAPPSIAAIGTFSSSQFKTQLWFAPAGFNRGGLTEGSAGVPVIGVREKLTSKQRDQLYEANINPIASFPAEGIVIFGQKTLQLTQSALDRINVRRLMIYVKKQISRIGTEILFDQNVPATWDRFLARANPFLAGIKTNFGLTDFRVILDDTTTTPELVDRNILYAKVYLKPARAIEYIAIDFNITNSGASFED